MDEGEDGTDVVRAACWKLCDAKDLCGSAPLCEGWGGVDEWRGEGDNDGKGNGVVDESVANIIVDGDLTKFILYLSSLLLLHF